MLPIIFQIIRLRREEESLDNIRQYWVQSETPEEKYNSIANIYGVVTIGQAMIFCQTRKTASWLVQKMTKDGHAVALLSGELTVEERIQVTKYNLAHTVLAKNVP
jgi:ATP-dependent RNA helicase DDX19/DBP5